MLEETRICNLHIFGAADFGTWQPENLGLVRQGLQLASPSGQSNPTVPNFELAFPPDQFRVAGQLLSLPQSVANGFDTVLLSWQAATPPQTWFEFRVRVLVAAGWSKFYRMGVWSTHDLRYSLEGQADSLGEVATDILFLKQRAKAFQIAAQFFTCDPARTPTLRQLVVTTVREGAAPVVPATKTAWGTDLAVPEYSQMVYPAGDGWCSPTSLVMVLAYWAAKTGRPELLLPVPATAEAVFDKVYDGCGNWPFNTAYAASLGGLQTYATFFTSLADLEKLISQGIPVIVSLAYKPGELTDAPIAQTAGHLLVVRGFGAGGAVITNDPAANPEKSQAIRRIYSRTEFERQWLATSGGGAYVILPDDYKVV